MGFNLKAEAQAMAAPYRLDPLQARLWEELTAKADTMTMLEVEKALRPDEPPPVQDRVLGDLFRSIVRTRGEVLAGRLDDDPDEMMRIALRAEADRLGTGPFADRMRAEAAAWPAPLPPDAKT